MITYIDQFRAAIHSSGLMPPEDIQPDGKLHRFASNGKRGDDAGWYVLYDDGIPAGAFGDWRTGITETWRADIGRQLSAQEDETHRTRIEAIRREREAEGAKRMSDARGKAAAIWQSAPQASEHHPYLIDKAIKAHGLRQHNSWLVVPVRDESGLLSLQFINAEGMKRFLTGGRVRGGYCFIGDPNDGTVCIVEGYATGASVHEATGYAVAVAFNAGNLEPVARALRAEFPRTRLMLCADDDVATEGNPGLTRARAAAQAVGGYLAVPNFGETRPACATDFNDLHRLAGAAAVKASIERAVPCESWTDATATVATLATDWPDPQPLDREIASAEPYPLDALPGAIGAAVREYLAYGQQPVALVASSALAVVSLAAQGLADVARDERLRGPLSLNFLIIAQSGERKTAADNALGAPLGEWERERAAALCDEIKRSRAALDAWAAEHDGLKAAIKSAVRRKPDEATKLRERLVEHALQKPAEVIAPRLRYEDVNPQSLAFMLASGHPSAALWSDEGGMVTGSHGMGNDSLLGFMAAINRLWDGGAIHHDRKQAQSVHLEGRRLTVSLMVQPAVLRNLTQRGGGLTRGSGFLARFLVAAPVSTMGTRLYQVPPRGMPALTNFHKHIRDLLNTVLHLDEQGRLSPPTLSMSPGAFSHWRDYHDEVECELKPLGDYATICDFAAKSAENAARIAACLHIFEGSQGTIQRDTMQAAIRIARWYLHEALRMLDVLEEPQAWTDARQLDTWLAEVGDTPARDVLRLGPSQLRDKARRNAAMEVLKETGRARVERHGKREILTRNPALQRIASAIPATFATSGQVVNGAVAEIAAVAVANGQTPNIECGEL